MKALTKTLIITGIVLFIFGLFWISIGDEMYYYKTTEYKTYTIELELVNGKKKVISTVKPVNSHFQILGDRGGYRLASLPDGSKMILNGHWSTVRHGVIDFKILEIK